MTKNINNLKKNLYGSIQDVAKRISRTSIVMRNKDFQTSCVEHQTQ